jgi:parvulin-like peptidyl-prolyl isomerase
MCSIFFVFFLTLTFGFNAKAKSIPVDGYAAVVNGTVITKGQVWLVIAPVEAQLRQVYSGAALNEQLDLAYEKTLDSLIERQLVIDEFNRLGLAVPDNLIDAQIDEQIYNDFKKDRFAFMNELKEAGITIAAWREEIRAQIIMSIMRKRQVTSKVLVSPGQVREAYEKNSEKYVIPAEVELRMISFDLGQDEEQKAIQKKMANTVRERLMKGEDFGKLAREVSVGARADDGGYFGWIVPNSRRAELAEVLEKLAPGEISEVIEAGNHLYLLTIEARKSERTVPFEQVESTIMAELRNAEAQRIRDEWVSRLKSGAFIRKYN